MINFQRLKNTGMVIGKGPGCWVLAFRTRDPATINQHPAPGNNDQELLQNRSPEY